MKVGIISIGKHCQTNILPVLNESSNIDIAGFYTRNKDVAKQIKQSYEISFFDDYKKLLNSDNIDFVYISSPNSLHYKYIKQAIKNNINVIVEKTAVCSLKEAQKIVELANNKNLLVYEAFMYKHHDQFKRLKKIIDKEEYGTPRKVFIDFGFPHLDRTNIRYQKELGGGALFDAGAYTISAMQELFDDYQLMYSSMKLQNYDVDTIGEAVFKSEDNCSFFLNWGFGLSYKNEINIWTDKAHIIVDRAFSKPDSHEATIGISKDGKIVIDSAFRCNHFNKMFEYITQLDRNEYNHHNNKLIDQMKIINEIVKNKK